MIFAGNSNITSFRQQGLEAASDEPTSVHWVGALQIDHFLNGHPAGTKIRRLFAAERGWKFLSIGTHDVFALCQVATQGKQEEYLASLRELYRQVFSELHAGGRFAWLVFPQPFHQINFPGLGPKDIRVIARLFYDAIGAVCKELNIPIIDPSNMIVDKNGEPLPQFVQRDCIHLNVEGIGIYFEKIKALTGVAIDLTSREEPFEPTSEVESFCSLLLDELGIPFHAGLSRNEFDKQLTVFVANLLRGRGLEMEVEKETELVDSGLLDSLSLVQVYTYATDLLKMEIPFDVDLRTLNSVEQIGNFLFAKKEKLGSSSWNGPAQQTFFLSLRGNAADPAQKDAILEADRRIAAMSDDLFRNIQLEVAIASHGVPIRYGVLLFWIALNKAARGDYHSGLEYIKAASDRQRAFPFQSPRIDTYIAEWRAKESDPNRRKMLWEMEVNTSVLRVASPAEDEAEKEYRQILALAERGDIHQSIVALERLARDNPRVALFANDLGVLYTRLGEKAKARASYQNAVSLEPANITFLKNFADFLYVQQGDIAGSVELYTRALGIKPDDVETLSLLGQICLVDLNRIEDGKVFFNRVLAVDPNNSVARETLTALNRAQPPQDSLQPEAGAKNDDVDVLIRTDDSTKEYLVTALVSTYNSERFIRGCLEDLEAQTIADNVEIILIDSCSQQNERAIVEEFQKKYRNIVYVRTKEREKLYAAWNRGIRMARGKYITNTNTDDRRLPYALEVEARALDKFPRAGMVYADIWGTTIENDRLSLDNASRYHLYQYSDFTLLNGLIGSNFSPQPMWRKSCHDLVGYFDESYIIAGDYEFFYRLAKRFGAIHIKAPLGLYLENPSGIEKSQPGLTRDEFRRLRKKFYSEISLDEFFPALSTFHQDPQARGSAFFELGNNCLLASLNPEYESAEVYYTQAQSLLGQLPQLVHNLAIARIGLGDVTRGIESLKSVAETLPASSALLQALGQSGGTLASLAPGALQVFLSEHPVVKAAREGKGVTIEDLKDRSFENAEQMGKREKLVSILLYCTEDTIHLKECIKSIIKHTPEPHELIVLADGLPGRTVKVLERIVRDNPHCRFLENKREPGFALSCNQGIQSSSGDYILLLDPATVVSSSWLSGMTECLERVPETGIVGPMTNDVNGPQMVENVGYASMNQFDEYASAFRKKNRYRRIPARKIDRVCLLFKRTLFERIGSLDEAFAFADLSVEDYCLRSLLLGHGNMICGDVLVHCASGKTDTGPFSKGNRNKLMSKWGGIDAQSSLGKRLALVNLLDRVRELYDRGTADQAFQLLLETVNAVPTDHSVYHAFAELLIDSKQFKHALDILDAMPDRASDFKALVLAGYCKEGVELLDEALADADRTLASGQWTAMALNLKGLVAFKQDDRPAAGDYFQKAIDADPGFGEPYTNLGVLRWSSGQRDEAIDLLERGFILSPFPYDIVTMYFSAVTEREEFSRAEQVFTEAKALNPVNRRIAFLLIDVLLKQGKHRLAMDNIEQAMIVFGIDDGILDAALAVRRNIGPLQIVKRSPPRNTLSLCMIVKNEQKHLARCLQSIKSVVDEIIVVDTGSSDRTKDIAAAFGAIVLDLPWTSDFSVSRNFSIEHATGDWIMVLDADESIARQDHDELRKLIAKRSSRPVAYDFVTRNYTFSVIIAGWKANDGKYPEEEAGTGWVHSDKVRLFPRDVRIKFINPVHELVEPTLHRSNIVIKNCAIPIHHYGKLDQGKDLSKGLEYYELGRKKLEKTGDNVDALRELANQAGLLNRCEEAVDLWNRVLKIQPDMVYAYINLVNVYMQIDKFGDALAAAKKAVTLGPDIREAICSYALCEMFAGDIERAVQVLEELIKRDPEYPFATILLLTAYLCSGRIDKSAAIIESQRLTGSSVFAEAMAPFISKLMAAGRITQAKAVLDGLAAKKIEHDQLTALSRECDEKLRDHPANRENP